MAQAVPHLRSLRLRDAYLNKSVIMGQMVDKWLWRLFSSVQNHMVAAYKTSKFIPNRNLRPPKIKTSNTVLFDRSDGRQIVMKLAIMTEYNPSFSADFS